MKNRHTGLDFVLSLIGMLLQVQIVARNVAEFSLTTFLVGMLVRALGGFTGNLIHRRVLERNGIELVWWRRIGSGWKVGGFGSPDEYGYYRLTKYEEQKVWQAFKQQGSNASSV